MKFGRQNFKDDTEEDPPRTGLTTKPIHLSDFASQPDIRIACDQSWTTPKWGSEESKWTGIPNVHMADDDRLYTFRVALVTCEKCISQPPKGC